MYGITHDTQDALDNAPMPVGINENVKLVSVLFKPVAENGAPVLQYNFEDERGRALRHIMWEVKPENVKDMNQKYPRAHSRANKALGVEKGDPITDEHAVAIAFGDFNAYNNHILNRFFTKEEIVAGMAGVASYSDFAKAIIKLFNESPTAKNTLVRLKVVYDNNYKYSSLPKNHYSPFIEEMTVPKESSTIVIDTKYDKITKPVATESPEDALNSLESGGLEDLPDAPF